MQSLPPLARRNIGRAGGNVAIQIQTVQRRRPVRVLVPKVRRRRKLLAVGTLVLGTLTLTAWSLGLLSSGPHDALVRAVETQKVGDHSGPLEGPEAAKLCVEYLNQGLARLESVQDFEAIFYRQERLGANLNEPETMNIKMRCEPRSAFLSWIDPHEGRELIWHRDAHEGKLLIHECGWKGKLIPIVKISTTHPLVVASGRRGIQELGIWNLAQMLGKHRKDIIRPEVRVQMTDDKSIGDRPCYCFVAVFPEAVEGLNYYQATIYLDKEWKFPIGCELFDKPSEEGGEPVLLEAYYYEDMKLNVGLTEEQFDPTNPNYHFGKGPASTQVP
jgi:hypothetical protein